VVVVVDQFVPRDTVAPTPKFFVRVTLEFAQVFGDGYQNFLQNILAGLIGDGTEHQKTQLRLNLLENFLRQPETVGQSRRHPVGADQFYEFGHRVREA